MTDDGCIYWLDVVRKSTVVHLDPLETYTLIRIQLIFRHDVDPSAVFLVNVGSHVRYLGDDVQANFAASWGQLQRAQLDHNM